MSIRALWPRLRKSVERWYARAPGALIRPAEPSAAPSTVAPPEESTPASALAPPAVFAPEDSPASRVEAPPPQVAAPEIAVRPSPGRWETDADLGTQRKLYDAPHRRRAFIVYVPAGWSREKQAPLIVLCHGCRQTPEELASGSRIEALADRDGWLVLMPRQTKWANPWRCWNWFEPSATTGGGEAGIVAAQVRFIRKHFRTDPRRVVAAGISAGAALAATLGLRYPRQVRAVVAHSGVASGAASSAIAARDAMSQGPSADVLAIGVEARAKFGSVLPVPLLAIHGEDDTVVSPLNSIALVRQYLVFNGHPAMSADAAATDEFPLADATETQRTPDGREVTTREWRVDERLVVRHVAIAGLGHAWSGGDDTLAFNDAHAPDATKLIDDFLRDALP